MSGRGLGHTGGTLDKLESIPGFRVHLGLDEFRATLGTIGCAMIGQTAQIAPADKVLYALRDVTATVESIPLISASIMSKKVAEGIDGLVLDVKCGRGAFMPDQASAWELASAMVAIGTAHGVRTEAVLTRMDEPLGRMVGNALEVVESVETLKGKGPADLEGLSVHLAARMVRLAGRAANLDEAERHVRQALASGRGLEKFRELVVAQGGDPRVVDDYSLLPAAPRRHLIRAAKAGFVGAIHSDRLGRAAMLLGAGRGRADEGVDPRAGIVVLTPQGTRVAPGDPMLELHYADDARLPAALSLAEKAVDLAADRPSTESLLLETIESDR
jgi:pyrimidine-nucleoside phosphorylase